MHTRLPLILLALGLSTMLPAAATASPSDPLDAKQTCVYVGPIAPLAGFDALVGRPTDCAMVYNDASPDWAGWEDPWFTHHPDPNYNWVKWQQAVPGRRLIITQNLFPSELNNTDWRSAGAAGAYTDHARKLAQRLVAVGQGNAVIRLAHEANGDWYADSIGNTDRQMQQWRQFWRKTVKAMQSVPGANFKFDFCVNAGYRAIPLSDYYPGNDVVDIIGIDAYDSASKLPAGAARWQALYDQPGGIHEVLDFAKAHGKPLSIPEWGIGPTGDKYLSAGDDPAYVDGIASVVRNNNVAYQSYFYSHQWATQLANSPRSLAAYRAHFGSGGDSISGATPDVRAARVAVRARRGRVQVRVSARMAGRVCVRVVRRHAAARSHCGARDTALRFTAAGRKAYGLRPRVRARIVSVVVVFARRGAPPQVVLRPVRLS